MKHLILTGFMGSGKTTIGEMVAAHLKLPFIDLDCALTEQTGLKPQFYIPRFGFPAFRRLEKQFLKKILSAPPLVLSTGGGVVLDPSNRQRMFCSGCIFWLYTPLSLILTRLGKTAGRPLLSKTPSLNQLKRLFKEREPFYQQCHFKILNAFDSPKEVAIQIVQKYVSEIKCTQSS